MLVINSLCKSFKKKTVLDNVSLEVSSGEIIGIVGMNGSGKSTMLSILSGVVKPDSGTFFFNEQNLQTNKKNISSIIGYVPQDTVLLEELTGLDNLKLWYEPAELKKALNSQSVISMLELQPFLNKTVSKMSGGMKKRISIACAVAHSPKILLLDEPSTALDLPCKEKLNNYYKQFALNGGIIIIATHEVQELELCTKTFVLSSGHLNPFEYDGNIQNLINSIAKEA